MVSTRKKRQSIKRLLSQLDDFDQDTSIGNTVSERQGNAVVNEGTNDRDFTVGISTEISPSTVLMTEILPSVFLIMIQLLMGML